MIVIEVPPLPDARGDWIHIVPGLHSEDRAWWEAIEFPFHVMDKDGVILSSFSLAKHMDIHLPPLYVRNDQSIGFANSEGDLMVRIYRKEIEMVNKHRKKRVSNPQPVLRIEVRLEGDSHNTCVAADGRSSKAPHTW